MGYRNETETLRVRVAALERDLADAHDTIDRLTGAVGTDLGRAATASRVIDAPSQVRLVRELDLTPVGRLQRHGDLKVPARYRGVAAIMRPDAVLQPRGGRRPSDRRKVLPRRR